MIKQNQLMEALMLAAAEETEKIGKDISWLRFAKKTKRGYRFLVNKELQWGMLERIVNRVAEKHLNYKKGQIVDLLSKLVNK